MADKAAQRAQSRYAGLMCPEPCGPLETFTKHGKPFAGGTQGRGIARSRWEVDYVCKAKKVEPPPPVNQEPGQIPPNGPPRAGGNEEVKPNVEVPSIPKCYGLPVDKDELLDQLHEMRTKAALNLPLGAEKGDPEMERAQAQANANVAAIDAAIRQARETPLCSPVKKSGFLNDLFGHVSVGVGVGVGGGHHHPEQPTTNTPHD